MYCMCRIKVCKAVWDIQIPFMVVSPPFKEMLISWNMHELTRLYCFLKDIFFPLSRHKLVSRHSYSSYIVKERQTIAFLGIFFYHKIIVSSLQETRIGLWNFCHSPPRFWSYLHCSELSQESQSVLHQRLLQVDFFF